MNTKFADQLTTKARRYLYLGLLIVLSHGPMLGYALNNEPRTALAALSEPKAAPEATQEPTEQPMEAPGGWDVELSSVEGQIRAIAAEQNFQWPDYLVKLAHCESRLNPAATNTNTDARKTTDRGVFQINDYWHPEVSDECAFDTRCATEWTMSRINAGYQHEWTCDDLI